MRTITLKHGKGRYCDDRPFVISDDLEIRLDGIDATNVQVAVRVKNNAYSETFNATSFTVPRDRLSAGELDMEVGVYLRGELISTFRVEPLILRDADLHAEPFTPAVQAKLDELGQRLDDYIKRAQTQMQELATAITSLKNEVELIKAGYDPLEI